MDLGAILNAIGNAKDTIKTATDLVQSFRDAGHTFSTSDEATLEQKISELEALLPALRQKTQNKLRGK